jgi:hypothetical protein
METRRTETETPVHKPEHHEHHAKEVKPTNPSLIHKTELRQFDDGTYVIDVQLHGNPRELQAIALGKTTGGFVKNILPTGEHNPDQLDFRIVLKPSLEAIKDEPEIAEAKAKDEATKEERARHHQELEARARGAVPSYDEETPKEERARHKQEEKDERAKSA